MVWNYGLKKVKIPEYAEVMLKNAGHTNPDVKKQSYVSILIGNFPKTKKSEFFKAVFSQFLSGPA